VALVFGGWDGMEWHGSYVLTARRNVVAVAALPRDYQIGPEIVLADGQHLVRQMSSTFVAVENLGKEFSNIFHLVNFADKMAWHVGY